MRTIESLRTAIQDSLENSFLAHTDVEGLDVPLDTIASLLCQTFPDVLSSLSTQAPRLGEVLSLLIQHQIVTGDCLEDAVTDLYMYASVRDYDGTLDDDEIAIAEEARSLLYDALIDLITGLDDDS